MGQTFQLFVNVLLTLIASSNAGFAPHYTPNDAINGSYIVQFKSQQTYHNHTKFLGLELPDAFVYPDSFGYRATLSEGLVERVRSDTWGVEHVDSDVDSTFFGDFQEDQASGWHRFDRRVEQQNVGWALGYLSAAAKVENYDPAKPDRKLNYDHVLEPGKGVNIYVIDTGVNEIDELRGRVEPQIDIAKLSTPPGDNSPTSHGTSVASCIAGAKYGIAKSATIIPVKSRKLSTDADGNEDFELDAPSLANAVILITEDHNRKKSAPGFRGSIINMSLGCSKYEDLEKALIQAYNAGITLVASAGNNRYNDHHYPSSYKEVISVGAATRRYEPNTGESTTRIGELTGSNYGNDNVDIWAPGRMTQVSDKSGNLKKPLGKGTSIAAGYVTGILAVYMGVESKDNQPLTPLEARELLFANADDYMSFSYPVKEYPQLNWGTAADPLKYAGPLRFANTGYLKGQAQNPKVPFLRSTQHCKTGPTRRGSSGQGPVCVLDSSSSSAKSSSTTVKSSTTTSKSPSATSKSHSTTSKPHSTTSKVPSTTNKSHSTTSKPHSTTSKPHSTTSKPHSTTSKPRSTTSKPNHARRQVYHTRRFQ